MATGQLGASNFLRHIRSSDLHNQQVTRQIHVYQKQATVMKQTQDALPTDIPTAR